MSYQTILSKEDCNYSVWEVLTGKAGQTLTVTQDTE